MFAIVPLLCYTLIYIAFYLSSANKISRPFCWRSCVLSTAIIWGILLTASTELLSLLNRITFGWILGFWGLSGFIAACICLLMLSNRKNGAAPVFKIPRLTSPEISLLAGIAFVVITIGLIALIAPPNNWDSMTYHMSRIFHWIQNRNVAHYPTHITRQLFLPPYAEFAIMHLQVLSGTDRLANLIQWFSMIGCLLGVSLIAQQFGANIKTQIFAALICGTIPMGILQASSTQNDYVCAFWLVCFVYYLLLLMKKARWMYSLAAGIGLGLALLTKSTAYIYSFPFLAWFVFSGYRGLRSKIWKHLPIIAVTALLINLGYYARNYDLFGNFLGSSEFPVFNSGITIPLFISNIVRNIGLHVGMPVESANSVMYGIIKLIHGFLGIDVNDIRITWPGTRFYIPSSLHEDDAGNFLHLLLIVFTVIIFLKSNRIRKIPNLMSYGIVVIGASMLFALCLKWQPWHSRLHLPFFVLWAPFMAMVLSQINNPFKQKPAWALITLIGFMLMLFSVPWVFWNDTRRSFGKKSIFTTSRVDRYFSNRRYLKNAYVGASNYIKFHEKGCTQIGLILGEDDWEYPFVVFVQKKDNSPFRIEHVNVSNVSSLKYAKNPFNNFSPSVIVDFSDTQNNKIINKDTVYVKKWSRNPKDLEGKFHFNLSVFVRQ